SAVLRVLEALGHHLRVFEIPQVELLVVITGDEEVEPPVAVVIEPDSAVGVDPFRKPCLLTHAREAFAAVVMVKLRLSPLVNEQIFVPIVVVISPDRSHRNTVLARVLPISPIVAEHLTELTVTKVFVEDITLALAAVSQINVLPAVAVEIHHRDRRAHRS